MLDAIELRGEMALRTNETSTNHPTFAGFASLDALSYADPVATEVAKIEAINSCNRCVDRAADLGAILVVLCILAGFVAIGGWLLWILVNQLAQANVLDVMDAFAGMRMIRP